MNRSITVSVPPAALPVSVGQAKVHLRVTQGDDDAHIQDLIEAATGDAERFLGRSLITQTLVLRLDGWPADGIIHLPRPPVASVTSVVYTDTAGAAQTLAPSEYFKALYGDDMRLVFTQAATWPQLQDGNPTPIRVTYVAGYGATVASVPALIRAGIQFRVAHLYEQRTEVVVGQSVAELSTATERCWAPYRIFSLS